MNNFRLALQLLLRDLRAGELTLIAVALVVAVASATTVGFFTDRVGLALNRQADQLLGADLVITSERELPAAFAQEALRRGLQVSPLLRFPSMVQHGDKNVLADIKVVAAGYPLRGEVRIADRTQGADRRANAIPPAGEVWADEGALARLGIDVGDALLVGNKSLRVGAVLVTDPDAAVGFFNAGLRILINTADVAATGLIQTGSRVRYRLQFAGSMPVVEAYRGWLESHLVPGQRIEGIRDARPEIRAALERAEKFLSIAALASVMLAAMAIALAARRYLQRHLDACAMLRCLGSSQGRLIRLHIAQFLLLGLVASLAGCAVGYAAQGLLVHWLGALAVVEIPQPSLLPAVQGLVIGVALLLGFALPPLIALAKVPALRVMRRDLGAPGAAGGAAYLLGYGVMAALIYWKAGDARLGSYVLAGFSGALLAAAGLTWLLLRAATTLKVSGVSWRFGIANLRRRPLSAIVQVISLGLGLMALLTLTLIQNELLGSWQASLPPEAPNRFLVNIQKDQVAPLKRFLAAQGIAEPDLFPMVRGRLIRINEHEVNTADYADERTRRLAEREFNMSSAAVPPKGNQIVAGAWWPPSLPGGAAREQYSMEDGIAERLGVKLGDRLTFDIAGTPVSATVTNLRKVDWDSFNVNFFLLAAPGLLDGQPISYITSFYLPPRAAQTANALVREFPNLLVIDVAQMLAQVQVMMGQVTKAIRFVFLFTLLAGLVVFYAAMAGTQDERVQQAAVMRALGASRVQLTRAHLAEFALIGTLAGFIGAAGASTLGYVLASRVLHVDFSFGPLVWLAGMGLGAIGITLAGRLGTQRVLTTPPLQVLRELA